MPERPVKPSHFSSDFASRELQERIDEVCARARGVIVAGGKITLAGLLRKDSGSGLYGWVRLLQGEWDWLLRKPEANI